MILTPPGAIAPGPPSPPHIHPAPSLRLRGPIAPGALHLSLTHPPFPLLRPPSSLPSLRLVFMFILLYNGHAQKSLTRTSAYQPTRTSENEPPRPWVIDFRVVTVRAARRTNSTLQASIIAIKGPGKEGTRKIGNFILNQA